MSEANVFIKPAEYEKQTDIDFSLLFLSAHLLTAWTCGEKHPYAGRAFAAIFLVFIIKHIVCVNEARIEQPVRVDRAFRMNCAVRRVNCADAHELSADTNCPRALRSRLTPTFFGGAHPSLTPKPPVPLPSLMGHAAGL